VTSRERVIKTLRFEEVDRVPRDIWALPGVNMFRKQELEALHEQYPSDFAKPTFCYGAGKRCVGTVAKDI